MQQREARTSVKHYFIQLLRQAKSEGEKEYSIINISRGGLCFASHDEFELNEPVKLNILLEEKIVHSANGRICYRNNSNEKDTSNYGLSFLDHFIDNELLGN